ncbi:MAG: DNA polymerase IV [Mogibacterium sp.]|nr:DNA polymerase IV [Mogibacterium sp.]
MSMDRKILHCDMNSFYCSVELLEHPELRGKPVAVAGDPENRHGIILAKSDAAKRLGVVTAETIQSARKKCPDLILLSPHYNKYSDYSKQINAIYLRYTNLVEPFSVDESWLDVTASERLLGPARQIADEIRATVKAELGLTLSVGVSFNKTFAKMGSEYKKPDATTEITRENYKQLLWPLPVGEFFFIGRATAGRLNEVGIRTVGELAQSDPDALVKLFGVQGAAMHRAVNGLDDEPVRPWGDRDAAKSIGHGVTFPRDICGADDVSLALTEICDEVGARLRRHSMKAYGVKVEVTEPDFRRHSRQRKLQTPITTAAAIKKESLALLRELGFLDRPIRLLTVTAINLQEEAAAEQLTIFNYSSTTASPSNTTVSPVNDSVRETGRDVALERTLDEIRRKFGKNSIGYARNLDDDLQ